MAIEKTSRTITLSWERPDTSSTDEPLSSYTVKWTGGATGSNTVPPSTLSTTINGLEPYTTYVCSVIPNYSGEHRGESVTRTVQTLELGETRSITVSISFLFNLLAPDSPPQDLSLDSSTSTSLTVSWSPPAQPNGLITHYTLYADYGDGSTATPTTMDSMFTISSLKPYQTVSVQVSASTSVGEGPRTETVEFTTDQASEYGRHRICMYTYTLLCTR